MNQMLSVAPASVLLLGVLGMFVIALGVLRMLAEERRHRGPVTVARVAPRPVPTSPRPVQHV
jgi:hypothetical protein